MPTYQYRCENCGCEFEKFQQMSAAVLKECPKCGKMTLKRLIGTGAAVIFKGTGFYETDYRSDSYKAGEQKDKAVPDTAAKTEKTSTDTKSA